MPESLPLNLVDPDLDNNRYNPDPHYRLYDAPRGGPTVICVQDFDYRDYDAGRFLSYDSYATQRDAEDALRALAVDVGLLAVRFRSIGLLP